MTKENTDPISSAGNLRMNHVFWLFQKLVIDNEIFKRKERGENIENEDFLRDEIGRSFEKDFGNIVIFSSRFDAGNPSLNNEIRDFVRGTKETPENYIADSDMALDLKVGHHKSFILISCNDLQNVGTEKEIPLLNEDFIPTHYTVLNLKKNEQGIIGASYADSLFSRSSAEKIPEKIILILEKHGISSEAIKTDFIHDSQGQTLDCGYHAVFNALRMLEIEPFPDDIESFIGVQREVLKDHFGEETAIEDLSLMSLDKNKLSEDEEEETPESEFFNAYYDGNYEKVKSMINENPLLLDALDDEGYPLLLLVVDDANFELLKHLLRLKNLNINIQNDSGQTALHLICDSDNLTDKPEERLQLAAILLGRKDIIRNVEDDDGKTPIKILSKKKEKDETDNQLLTLLKQKQKKNEIEIKETKTLLPENKESSRPQSLEEEIKENAKLQRKLISERQGHKISLLKRALTKKFKNKEAKKEQEELKNKIETFIKACFENDLPKVKSMLQEDESYLNSTDESGNTGLILASQAGNLEIVNLLLSYEKLEINAQDIVGTTALHIAASNLRTNVVKSLLNHENIDIDIEDSQETTAEKIIGSYLFDSYEYDDLNDEDRDNVDQQIKLIENIFVEYKKKKSPLNEWEHKSVELNIPDEMNIEDLQDELFDSVEKLTNRKHPLEEEIIPPSFSKKRKKSEAIEYQALFNPVNKKNNELS